MSVTGLWFPALSTVVVGGGGIAITRVVMFQKDSDMSLVSFNCI